MKQKLYTIFLDFKGDTYISQALAENLDNAIVQWFNTFDFECLKATKNNVSEIREDLVSEGFTPIANIKNVWCTSALLKNELMLFNIIMTDQDS